MKTKLNIVNWLEHLYKAIVAMLQNIFSGIASLLRVPPRAPATAHENIQAADVDAAGKEARVRQEAIDTIADQMTPAQIVEAYCRATEDGRMSMNLGKLSIDQQCWLLRLTDADLVMLGSSGTAACARSLAALKVLPSFRRIRTSQTQDKPDALPGPPIDSEALKRIQIRDRYREVFRMLSNPNAHAAGPSVH